MTTSLTTPLLTLKLSIPLPPADKKRRVLLVDDCSRKRELRAEVMRKLGMDVDSAADIIEARSWWKVDLYDLILINVENEQGSRDKFCDDMRSAVPRQRFAFLVGKPEYLSDSPRSEAAIQESDEHVSDMTAVSSAGLEEGLPQRWGILEASRRISEARHASVARTQAMRNRPAPPRDSEGRPTKRTLPGTLDDLLGEEMQ